MDVEVRPDFPLPAYKAPDGQAAGQDDQRRRRRRPAQALPRALRPDRAQARRRAPSSATSSRPTSTFHTRRHGAQRGQGDPVPAPARAAVPGRDACPTSARPWSGSSRARPARPRPRSAPARPIPSLRGQTIRVTFHGPRPEARCGCPRSTRRSSTRSASTASTELREALREVLERRLEFQQRQAIRREILDKLIAETPFDLPADLVARQEKTTIRRLVMEMRQEGLSDDEIRAREAEIRANAHESTLRSLKEFFILAKIAEAEEIKVEEEDLERRSRRSPPGPTRARGGSAPGSRRKGWPRPSRRRSSSGRRSTASSSTSSTRRSRWSRSEVAVETLDQTATAPPPEAEDDRRSPARRPAKASRESTGRDRPPAPRAGRTVDRPGRLPYHSCDSRSASRVVQSSLAPARRIGPRPRPVRRTGP